MPTFASYDGTVLHYRVLGSGPTLVCVPGGPGRASEYFGDLGGLSAVRTLVQLDVRGTGGSAVPADPATYRVDRVVDDVEALRAHLGLETFDLLGHSAGSNVAALYAAEYPHRVASLTIVTGLLRVAGLKPYDWDAATEARSGEPWYADAMAADAEYDELDDDCPPEQAAALEARMAPFGYGAWTPAAAAHNAAAVYSDAARAGFYGDYQPDPDVLGARLAELTAPVLVIAGQWDRSPSPAVSAEVAALFPTSALVTVPGAGHFPWVDNPDGFVAAFGVIPG